MIRVGDRVRHETGDGIAVTGTVEAVDWAFLRVRLDEPVMDQRFVLLPAADCVVLEARHYCPDCDGYTTLTGGETEGCCGNPDCPDDPSGENNPDVLAQIEEQAGRLSRQMKPPGSIWLGPRAFARFAAKMRELLWVPGLAPRRPEDVGSLRYRLHCSNEIVRVYRAAHLPPDAVVLAADDDSLGYSLQEPFEYRRCWGSMETSGPLRWWLVGSLAGQNFGSCRCRYPWYSRLWAWLRRRPVACRGDCHLARMANRVVPS